MHNQIVDKVPQNDYRGDGQWEKLSIEELEPGGNRELQMLEGEFEAANGDTGAGKAITALEIYPQRLSETPQERRIDKEAVVAVVREQ